jgi:hypothetical protein
MPFPVIHSTPPLQTAPLAWRSLAETLAPLDRLAGHSSSLIAKHDARFEADGRTHGAGLASRDFSTHPFPGRIRYYRVQHGMISFLLPEPEILPDASVAFQNRSASPADLQLTTTLPDHHNQPRQHEKGTQPCQSILMSSAPWRVPR